MIRAAAVVFFAGTIVVTAKPPEHSVSPSAQFIVYGDDGAVRGAISTLAEKTKANLLSVLHVPDGWKTPVIVNLQPMQANVPELPPAFIRFSQTGFGLKIQLDLTVGPTWDRAAIERELLRALLLEMMYRAEPDLVAGATYVEPPGWLIDGLLASAPGRARDSLVDGLNAAGKIMSLEEFLGQRAEQLDSPARQLYRGYAFAMVQLLAQRENGRALARYIEHLPRASSEPIADLRQQFPELNSAEANGSWRAEVARVKVEYGHQLLTVAETDQNLQTLIGKVPLREMAQRKISKTDRPALVELKLQLLLLAARANPILRPTVQDYQGITVALLSCRKRGVVRQLSGIEDLHRRISSRMNEIDDYMNWFEAAKLTRQSGSFDNSATAAKGQTEAAPRRRDPISIYLDALEEQF